MTLTRLIAVTALGLGLSACASVDTPTRNAPFEELPTGMVRVPDGFEMTGTAEADMVTRAAVSVAPPVSGSLSQVQGVPVTINSITVHVPRTLKVSEANRFLPKADIVWRGDPVGDRYAQVGAIFEAGLLQGVQGMNGPTRVDLDVEVLRFHSLTEKARYFTGGVHAIEFTWTLKDPETGAVLIEPRTVNADLDGLGGRKAIEADSQGQTMKVRISDHLAAVIVEEMTTADGHHNASLGLIQALNKI